MTKKEIVEILLIPSKEISSNLKINDKALVCLVLANTRWLRKDKKYFDFRSYENLDEQEVTKDDMFEVYLKFIDSFEHFNETVLKKNRNFKKGWKNRKFFKGFVYGLYDADIIDKKMVDNSFKILKTFRREDWEKMINE